MSNIVSSLSKMCYKVLNLEKKEKKKDLNFLNYGKEEKNQKLINPYRKYLYN